MDGDIKFMDIRKIKRLIKLVEQSNIDELNISDSEMSIHISRVYNTNIRNSMNIEKKHTVSSQKPMLSSNFPSSSITNIVESVNSKCTNHIIRSPIVGIFYINNNSSNLKAFIKIGKKINVGDTLCIIEAMKMMNHIKSDRSGMIKDILVKNGDAVEFNEPLIIIES